MTSRISKIGKHVAFRYRENTSIRGIYFFVSERLGERNRIKGK
ncbi:hypothetical protein [Bacillus sp. B1-b2]|nr:hypothetical protein [Bacillus sp. B1-b2]